MSRPVDVFLKFLAAEQVRGVRHVHLDEGARLGLRELRERTRAGARTAAVELVSLAAEPASVRVVELTAPPADNSRAEQLAALRRQAEQWPAARALGTLRETLVFATGNPDAQVMFIGEAPGYQEEKEGQPFVGPAGQKLDVILKTMSLSREQVYLSHIVKFRPATPNQTTNNRPPSAEEMAVCLPFIRGEIRIVKPQLIVALGETAAAGLLGITGTMEKLRGCWHDFEGTPVRVTYPPSYLLQTSGSSQIKRLFWEDMLSVMEQLGLPISEKQRAFFLPKP